MLSNASMYGIIYTCTLYSNPLTQADLGIMKITATNNTNNYAISITCDDITYVDYLLGFVYSGTSNFVSNVLVCPNLMNLNFRNNITISSNCCINPNSANVNGLITISGSSTPTF